MRFTAMASVAIVLLASLPAAAQYGRPRGGFGRAPVRSGGGDERPNIIVMLADDMGFSDVGAYGGEILTPNLDNLAKDGLRFTQFYNCGRCCPTRASLLTGLYPHQTGVGHMMTDYGRPGYRGNLNKECVTIAELLSKAGYQTMMAGKWHVTRHTAPEGPKHTWPLQRGFEEFAGTIHGGGSYFDPVTLCRGNQYQRETKGEFYYTDWIAQRASEMIEKASRDEKPFFLYVAFTAPHWPLHAPREVIDRYRGNYATGWDSLREARYRRMKAMGIIRPNWQLSARDPRVGDWESTPWTDWQQRRMEVYAAQVDLLDQGIGRVMEKLRQVGLERNTLVMFLADNGACAEEVSPRWKGLHIPEQTRDGRPVQVGNRPDVTPGPEDTYQSYGMAWANASNTPLRMYKHYAHEGGIATPLIVRWPTVIRDGGEFVRQPGHVIDIMPTCLEVARYRYPKLYEARPITPLEGRSLVPLFEGETREPKVLCWEHEGNRAVRDGKWKIVALKGRPWELYDMEADRSETVNLAEKYPVIVQDLESTYNVWAERCNVLPWRR